MAQLPRQPPDGRSPSQPIAPLLPHRPHQGTVVTRSSRLNPVEPILTKHDYIRKVLDAYRRMPGATGTVRPNDRLLAAALHDRGIPLLAIENAILLAAARRIFRSPDAPPLQPVRSLSYVLPVIDEVLAVRVSQDYYRYVRFKINQALIHKNA